MLGRFLLWVVLASAVWALAGCGPQAKDLTKGERGRVARVVDGDTLELEGGLRVHLVSIEAPRETPWDQRAREALERLAQGREVELRYGGEARLPGSDRYPAEAALAHVFVRTEGGRWIWAQGALLRDGFARVHTRKDNLARAERMLAEEALAREEKRGLWRESRYAVRAAARPFEAEGFMVVEGVVRSVQQLEERTYLNFGEDYRTDFTIAIAAEHIEEFRRAALDPATLEDRKVRVRGYVRDRGGPLITADHPAQLEVLT